MPVRKHAYASLAFPQTNGVIRVHETHADAELLAAAAAFTMTIAALPPTSPAPARPSRIPIYAKWAEAYKQTTGNGMNYQSIGSGGGIKQIKAKTVDFGASDMPLKARGPRKPPASCSSRRSSAAWCRW